MVDAVTIATAATIVFATGFVDAAAAAAAGMAIGPTEFFWRSIRADCRVLAAADPLDMVPLWSGKNPFERDWRNLRAKLPEDWQFWRDWYQAALDGTPPNWEKLERIALIDNEIWDAGPAAVNEEIAKIEIEFAVAATPNAEEIRINRAGKYQAVARSGLPARTLHDVNDRIGDTIRRIRAAQANNQYAALLPEADLLQDIQSRYGDNPLRLYEVCLQVVRHVGVHVANGVLPENDNLVGDVAGDLQNNSDDIYNLDEDARQTIDARAKLRFGRLDDGEKQRIIDLTEAVADHAVNALAQELREDAQAISQEIEPSEETSANRYRLSSRLVRVVALGGTGLVAVVAMLAQAPEAVAGAQFLWQIIRPLVGF